MACLVFQQSKLYHSLVCTLEMLFITYLLTYLKAK